MSEGKEPVDGVPAGEPAPRPTAREVASGGIHTSRDVINVGKAVITDILHGRIPKDDARGVCRAGRMIWQGVALEQRYNNGKPIDLS